MSQSRRASLIEAIANVLVGYLISVLANIWLLPLWGFSVSPRAGAEIGLLFTLISLLRSYLLRRYFNSLLHKASLQLAKELSPTRSPK